MKRIIILLGLLLLPAAVFAYNSPGRADGFVNDFAEILSAEQERDLENLLYQYEQQTGSEIAVVTIPKLFDETIETYATRLYEDWGIGKKGQDNGALFLVSLDDREMRIEVGYGLEEDLTDVEANHLTDIVVPPYFRNEDYDGGVRAAVVGMLSAIDAHVEPIAGTRSRGDSGGMGDYFWLLIFIPIWLGSIFARSRSWWAGGVVGAVAGAIVWLVSAAWWWLPILIVFGLVFDYLVSTKYKKVFMRGDHHSMMWPLLFLMGGRPGRRWDKGGFGGFGGGFSGGGGASGDW
jgi:uncharacterized protein